jgi:Flp pilus assembly CpaF family ATPase
MLPAELQFLTGLLADDRLNEVMFNGHEQVFIEREGKLQSITSPLKTAQELDQALTALAALPHTNNIGRLQSDGMLPDGSRFHMSRPPQSPDYPTLSIRKFVPMHRGLDNLVATGALSSKAAQFLTAAVQARLNIMISGSTSSGKTTLLNSLCAKVNASERIITVEDIPEIQLSHANWVRLVAVPDERGGTLRDCVVGCLRMRPDRIIVGECRSSEALEMLQAMNTGHDGGMTTLHANSSKDALTRLESLILFHAGAEIPIRSLRRQIVDALDLIVHVRKTHEGRRQIEEILSVESMEGEIITRTSLFRRDDSNANARLLSSGIPPGFLERFKMHGVTLPPYFFDPMALED